MTREARPLLEARPSLPEDAAERNAMPMADGLLDYFPNALAYVAMVSKDGNDQHNPGQPLHWARGKSTDHRNKILRHAIDFDRKDERGIYHAGRLAWRALALLQELLERQQGAPLPRGARLDEQESSPGVMAINGTLFYEIQSGVWQEEPPPNWGLNLPSDADGS